MTCTLRCPISISWPSLLPSWSRCTFRQVCLVTWTFLGENGWGFNQKDYDLPVTEQLHLNKSIPVWSLYYSRASAELINILESENGGGSFSDPRSPSRTPNWASFFIFLDFSLRSECCSERECESCWSPYLYCASLLSSALLLPANLSFILLTSIWEPLHVTEPGRWRLICAGIVLENQKCLDHKADGAQRKGVHRVHLAKVRALFFLVNPQAWIWFVCFYLLLNFSRILAGTWNVNGRHCTENLGPYLNYYTAGAGEPDIYVLGYPFPFILSLFLSAPCVTWWVKSLLPCPRFQELDLSAQAFLLDNSGREDDWSKLIENSFKKKGLFKKVKAFNLLNFVKPRSQLNSPLDLISDCLQTIGWNALAGVREAGFGSLYQGHSNQFCWNRHLGNDGTHLIFLLLWCRNDWLIFSSFFLVWLTGKQGWCWNSIQGPRQHLLLPELAFGSWKWGTREEECWFQGNFQEARLFSTGTWGRPAVFHHLWLWVRSLLWWFSFLFLT